MPPVALSNVAVIPSPSGSLATSVAPQCAIASPATHVQPAKPMNSKELALACGFILGRHFFDLEDLHYGYWLEGELPRFENLRGASAVF